MLIAPGFIPDMTAECQDNWFCFYMRAVTLPSTAYVITFLAEKKFKLRRERLK